MWGKIKVILEWRNFEYLEVHVSVYIIFEIINTMCLVCKLNNNNNNNNNNILWGI